MMKYGILKFSLRERICTKGVRFVSFPEGKTYVVNTKSPSKIDRWAKVSDAMELIELLGPVGNKETESKILHYSMNIKPCKYPQYSLQSNNTTDQNDIVHNVFSVDNSGTRDIDDAISVVCHDNKIKVGIHITDVANVLHKRLNNDDKITLLDFAMKRASSTYTDIENTPMLPPYLTYNELSLIPGEIRQAITLWLEYENNVVINNYFESCYVKNYLAIDYSAFANKCPKEFHILSQLSEQTEPTDIIAWSMLTYNKYFALSFKNIILRHQTGTDMAQYSMASNKLKHETIGSLYTHATSPIRRYADLYNQFCWHSLNDNFLMDLNILNDASLNVKTFQKRHAIMDLSYACRFSAQRATVESSREDTCRVICNNTIYTIPRYDSFYEGQLIPDSECFIWGILKNGISTLRIRSAIDKDIRQEDRDIESISKYESSDNTELDVEDFKKEDVETLLNHPLDAFQTRCYEVICSGDDVFGSAPTGSGKTAVAMTAIFNAFNNNKRAIYTSPIKSLSNEKYADFRNKLDGRVSLLTGDIKLRCSPPGGDGASELIVMTAEILRNKLCSNNPDPDLNDVSVVIIDECHYINDTDRGTVWEETFMLLSKQIQVVALSATLDKPEKFCSWLSQRRPTQLVERFDRHVPLYFGNIRTASKKNDDQLVIMDNKDSKTYVWNVENDKPSFAKLSRSLIQLDLCPAIIFCMGRKRCVTYAESISDNLILPKRPFKPKESAREEEHDAYEIELKEHNVVVVEYKRKFDSLHKKYLGKFRKQLESIHGYDEFITLLQKGVAYHHAAMIPILREFVEVLFREKLIMVVFATETLGCGIDMPARTVVFTQLDKPCSDSTKRLLRTEEFMQMAGRAGRRGRDVKGYVLYYSYNNEKIPYSTFATLALGKSPQATSQLQITPDLVLRNYSKGIESIDRSLFTKELVEEEKNSLQEYEKLHHKFETLDLERIIDLEQKMAGVGFIKLTSKQLKTAKTELKQILGEITMEDAKSQWQLYNTLRNCKSTVNTLWMRCIENLYDNNFIDFEHSMTQKGIIASHMCDGMPMVRAHILDNINCKIDVESLVPWLAVFAGGPTFNSNNLKIPHGLNEMLKHSSDCAEYYYGQHLDSGIAHLMYDWITYKDISRILHITTISSFGSFIKVVLRVSSFIEETKTILLGLEKYEEYNKLENYEECLFAGMVGNDSIYI